MPQTLTHNEWIIRPPPGATFTVWITGEVMLNFERGREREVKEWLTKWIESRDPDYIDPRIATIMRRQAEQEATKKLQELTGEDGKPVVKAAPPPKPPPTTAELARRANMPHGAPADKEDFIPCGATNDVGKSCVLPAGHAHYQGKTEHEWAK